MHARLFGEDTSSDDDDDDDDDAGPLSASTHSKPNGDGDKQITPFLAQILQLFDDPSAAGVNDWSTSDGISFKVLGPYVAAHPHPRRAARLAHGMGLGHGHCALAIAIGECRTLASAQWVLACHLHFAHFMDLDVAGPSNLQNRASRENAPKED